MEANYKVAENIEYFGKLREVIDDPLFIPNFFTYFTEHVNLTNFQPKDIMQTEVLRAECNPKFQHGNNFSSKKLKDLMVMVG